MLKNLVRHLRSATALLVCFTVPLAVVSVILAEYWLSQHPVEELVLFLGVPILLLCLGIRVALAWFVSRYGSPRLQKLEGRRADFAPAVPFVCGLLFVMAMVIMLMAPMFLLATPIYAWLDMPWALREAVYAASTLTIISFVMAAVAFVSACLVLAWRGRTEIVRHSSGIIENLAAPKLLRLASLFR